MRIPCLPTFSKRSATAHIRIDRLFGAGHNVWIKSARSNPGGSIEDRIGLSMAEDAEAGKFKPVGRSSNRHRATPASVEFVDSRHNNQRTGKVYVKAVQTVAAGIAFGRPYSAPFGVR